MQFWGNRTCHWGFDSANWRAYLHLADDYTQDEQDKLMKTVDSFKNRYTTANHKRKLVSLIFILFYFSTFSQPWCGGDKNQKKVLFRQTSH